MDYQYINTEVRDRILILTMHDPPTRNALDPEMAVEVMDALDQFEDDLEQRVLLLTGTEPSFCSGANVRGFRQSIQERQDQPGQNSKASSMPWGKMEARLASRPDLKGLGGQAPLVPLRIHKLQKPSIAAVNGHAMGVGMGIALACDIRFAAEKAVFSEAFSRMGLIPGDGSSWQLPRLIGLSNTLLLQYTGDRIDGHEAYRMGVVSKGLPDDDLMDAALELATRLARGATQSLSLIKYLVHKNLKTDFEESLGRSPSWRRSRFDPWGYHTPCPGTEDHKEAVQAFLEKRQPEFNGR